MVTYTADYYQFRDDDDHNWHVFMCPEDVRDIELLDSYRTEAEARAEADRLGRCEALRNEIAAALDDCEDPAVLAAVMALLTK